MIILYVLFFIIILTLITFSFNYKEEAIELSSDNIIYDEDMFINEINIYGTHNSMTYKIKNILSPFGKTQTINLENQLKYNIRYFDLRFDDKLINYHGFINLGITYKEVFNIFLSFLRENPNQFIIITLKDEKSNNDSKISKLLHDKYINNHSEFFILNNSNWTYIPKIKSIKGKIFILNQSIDKNGNYISLNWKDNSSFNVGKLMIHDIYKITYLEKNKLFKKFIETFEKDKLNIFFLSKQVESLYGIKEENKFFIDKIKKTLKLFISSSNGCILIFDYFELWKKQIIESSS